MMALFPNRYTPQNLWPPLRVVMKWRLTVWLRHSIVLSGHSETYLSKTDFPFCHIPQLQMEVPLIGHALRM